eukprot:TRINITY_DN9021_c0_g1_i1.p1 TRINITY_DN9021_c0_g1~~TRINITY_DN9021_c0_g1_i1.p1  ORF type:complete len:243 (+),score=49.40 TRINITY_DN9021_c0_g1_i1:29-757(+)
MNVTNDNVFILQKYYMVDDVDGLELNDEYNIEKKSHNTKYISNKNRKEKSLMNVIDEKISNENKSNFQEDDFIFFDKMDYKNWDSEYKNNDLVDKSFDSIKIDNHQKNNEWAFQSDLTTVEKVKDKSPLAFFIDTDLKNTANYISNVFKGIFDDENKNLNLLQEERIPLEEQLTNNGQWSPKDVQIKEYTFHKSETIKTLTETMNIEFSKKNSKIKFTFGPSITLNSTNTEDNQQNFILEQK